MSRHLPNSNLEEETIYSPPQAQLLGDKGATFVESLESIQAFESLKILWMLRGVADILVIGSFLWLMIQFDDTQVSFFHTLVSVIMAVELFFIVQFFRKEKSAIIPLHIFSALSVLNIPLGTFFSLYHYIKSRSLEWPND